MRIFITGANGQLAKSFIEQSHDIEFKLASKESLDVTSKSDVLKQISSFNPDVIFHFASMTRGDECVKNPELATLINVTGTKNVVEAAQKIGAALLFVSTNEVFDGKKTVPYTEIDPKNPITIAGQTKHEAEDIIINTLRNYYVIRTSWLFSKWSSNFLHAVLDKAKNTKKLELVEDEISSPTYSKDLADAIIKLIKQKKYGVYHFVNEGSASRLDFAKKAFEIQGLDGIEITPIKLDTYNRLSKPPLFSALQNTKGSRMKILLPTWEDALYRFLTENSVT